MQEYQFRGIQKSEWNNLFNFIQAKRLRIENVAEAEMGPSGAARPGLDIDLGEDIDTGNFILLRPQWPSFLCFNLQCHIYRGMTPHQEDYSTAGTYDGSYDACHMSKAVTLHRCYNGKPSQEMITVSKLSAVCASCACMT